MHDVETSCPMFMIDCCSWTHTKDPVNKVHDMRYTLDRHQLPWPLPPYHPLPQTIYNTVNISGNPCAPPHQHTFPPPVLPGWR